MDAQRRRFMFPFIVGLLTGALIFAWGPLSSTVSESLQPPPPCPSPPPTSAPLPFTLLSSWPTLQPCSAAFLKDRPPLHFYGQYNYDSDLYRTYFNDMCNGVFVEVGANDGSTFSQSLVFEEQLNWRGICIEPQPNKFANLVQRRPHCININAGISNGSIGVMTFVQIHGYSEMLSSFEEFITPAVWERINREVAMYNQTMERIQVKKMPLGMALSHAGVTHVDYMSIDTEGNELEVLRSIDWNNTDIGLLFIEAGPAEKDNAMYEMLLAKGYQQMPSIGFNVVYKKKRGE